MTRVSSTFAKATVDKGGRFVPDVKYGVFDKTTLPRDAGWGREWLSLFLALVIKGVHR